MAQVRIYGYFRNHVAESTLTAPGDTVGAALDWVCAHNPALAKHIFTENGLSDHVRVILRGRDIELHNGLATPVSETDQIGIFPPISGGGSIEYRVSSKPYSKLDTR
jgi:MoaD family protein